MNVALNFTYTGFFSPVTAYAIKQSNGKLEAAGEIFDAAPYGWPVAKGSPLAQSLQQALQHLIDDGTFDGYIAAFQKLYPNITIKYEGITDYANDMTTRLTSNDWGDLCMIPTTIPLTELPKTPDQFLDALQKIKDYDASIDPLYTNYAAGWTMSA